MIEQIRNQRNEIIGYVTDYGTHQEVRNKHFTLVGRIVNGETRDKFGNLVSFFPNPGLLFSRLNDVDLFD